MAECSESTGTISAPAASAASMTNSPAQTRVSLLARAMRFFSLMAARVGFNPTIPTTAVTTVSASGIVAASIRASKLPMTFVSVSARRTARSFAAASSVSTARRGLNCRACSSMRSTLAWAVKAATRRPICSATSSVWRPIEPVEPKMEIVLLIVYYFTKFKMISMTGVTNSTLSNRSSTPPCSRNRWP